MDLLDHFRTLARYNRIANTRLFEACGELADEARRVAHRCSFGSIHNLLNHVLLGDRIWMARFQGGGEATPPLATVLYEDFDELRTARGEQDSLIETFFENAPPSFLDTRIPYVNNQSKEYLEEAEVAVAHFFNHQAHHRGQIHVLISQSSAQPPSLDLHRILNP